MNKTPIRFFYLLASNIGLEVRTNSKSVGLAIRKLLFPKHVTKKASLFISSITVLWDKSKNQYTFNGRYGVKKSAETLDMLIPHIDEEARWIILNHLPPHIIPIHGSCIIRHNKAILLVGRSGGGKSKALLDLVHMRYAGLSDEMNMLDLKTLKVFAYLRTWVFKNKTPMKGERSILLKRLDKPVKHYYTLQKTLGQPLIDKSCPLQSIFRLKTRFAKKKYSRKLTEAEVIKILAESSYVFYFQKISQPVYQRKYTDLINRLFASSFRLQKQIRGFDLTTSPGKSFSHLIMAQ